jgi:hypothetical protein
MEEMLKQVQSMWLSGARRFSRFLETFSRREDASSALLALSLGCLFFVVLIPPPSLAAQEQEAEQEQDQDEEKLPAARQNLLLRSHFRQMYPKSATGWNSSHKLPPNDAFLEGFIDRQIDDYLERIEEELTRLETNLAVAEKLRERILGLQIASGVSQQRAEALVGFDRALKEVQSSADNLKDQLEYAFTGLQGKKKLEHVVDSTSQEDFYEEELWFLRRQTDEADERIRNYLFRSVNTVDVKDLQEDTMMVCLYWVEKMAQEIRRSLK